MLPKRLTFCHFDHTPGLRRPIFIMETGSAGINCCSFYHVRRLLDMVDIIPEPRIDYKRVCMHVQKNDRLVVGGMSRRGLEERPDVGVKAEIGAHVYPHFILPKVTNIVSYTENKRTERSLHHVSAAPHNFFVFETRGVPC